MGRGGRWNGWVGDRVIGGAVVACACVVLPGVGARVLARAKGEGASLRMYGGMRRRCARWCLRAGSAGEDELCRA